MSFCGVCTVAADSAEDWRSEVYKIEGADRITNFKALSGRDRRWLLKRLRQAKALHCTTENCTCQHRIPELEAQ